MLSERGQGGYQVWSDAVGGIEVRFVGRGPKEAARATPGEVLAALGEGDLGVAWARQIHSAQVLSAVAGLCGEADGLVTTQRGLALTVVTADCVPILVADRSRSQGWAAVHAGWRGLVAGVIARSLERLATAMATAATSAVTSAVTPAGVDSRARPADMMAWIGPTIGGCCYEVGEEVSSAVVAASGGDTSLIHQGASGRPHLDLQRAAALQLTAAGVGEVRRLEVCTRCNPELLYSYRRQGAGGGRNIALIWAR